MVLLTKFNLSALLLNGDERRRECNISQFIITIQEFYIETGVLI